MKALLLKGLFYGWLILAVRECCVCQKLVVCAGEGLPVRFVSGCCQSKLDSTYVTRFEMSNPTNRKTFRLSAQMMRQITGEASGYEFDLARTLGEVADPTNSQPFESEWFHDDGKITKLLPSYGFIVYNRPARFEYRITNIKIQSFDISCASKGECLRTESYVLNGIFVSSNRIVVQE